MKKFIKTVALVCALAVILPMASALAADPVIQGNDKASVDVTNIADGYIKVSYKSVTKSKLKVIIQTPKKTQYNYNLAAPSKADESLWEVFPLSEGDGKYTIGVYTNTSGNKYATTYSANVDVKLKDSYAPFLVPSQYVNYTDKSKTVARATEITKGKKTDLEKVAAVYDEVIKFTYDKELAANVQSGYLPDVDKVLASKKGICFDYAAVMTAMLRSQNIPCQLVVGYAGDVYHAWINVYTKETGWVEGFIQFDGKQWSRMDPTFDSTGKGSDSVKKYIGDGKNYAAKYYY
ncbi:MAG: transglutaminase-like domain-containing protein [Oscillospiraceae bacterium]|jgi:transglutaminase-like putative cysteine protease|nr:transglutaminase-like domain-containing protein [Oscillospiraceae bacterium]